MNFVKKEKIFIGDIETDLRDLSCYYSACFVIALPKKGIEYAGMAFACVLNSYESLADFDRYLFLSLDASAMTDNKTKQFEPVINDLSTIYGHFARYPVLKDYISHNRQNDATIPDLLVAIQKQLMEDKNNNAFQLLKKIITAYNGMTQEDFRKMRIKVYKKMYEY